MKTEFVKYNRERLPSFQTETSIVIDQKGRRFVRKRSLTNEGEGHIARLKSAYDLMIKKLDSAKVPKPSRKGGYMIFDFVQGESMEEVLMQATISGDRKRFLLGLDQYVQLLRSYGTMRVASFEPKGGLEEFFTPGKPILNEECLKVANLDLTLDNIIVDPDGNRWITDYEWVYDSPIPLSFIIFRGIYVFYLKHANYAPEMIPFTEALAITGVNIDDQDIFTKICESFIDHVFGKDRQLLIPKERMQPVWRFLDTTGGTEAEGTVRWQQGRIEEILTTSEERGKALKHLSEENSNLRSLHAIQEKEICSLREETRILPSLREKVTRLEADIAIKTRELDRELSHSRQLSGSLNMAKSEILTLTSQAAKRQIELDELRLQEISLSELVSVRNIEIREAHNSFERVNNEFNAKQAELMAMSDWAYRMKLRLEFIDSKPFVRNTEKYYRLKCEAMDKLRSEGIKEFTRAAMLKFMPRKAKQWMLNDDPADQMDLVKSVESCAGKVIVVFPIIPWEFRWQRPQQIVSRFAKNGYTVIFASMSVSAKGKTYKNEKEAGKDVRLGKLGENIFQAWLSSEGKVNLYHDKLTAKDVVNLELGIMAILRSVQTRRRYYFVQFPGWTDVALTLRKRLGGKLIFDCMDDHSGFSNNTDDALKLEDKLLEQADLVVATSQKLYDKSSKLSDRVLMVKNGTDFEFFNHLAPNGELDNLPHPIIGYYGAISDWFDAELVEYAARAHPEWNFVLIGSTLGCDTSQLEKLTNVHLLGEKPYRELPGFLFYFDVCIIPFKITPLTLATNPVKFYEYLSSGKPMVAVRLPELVPYQDLCYLSDSKEEFVNMMKMALAEKGDGPLVQKRIEFAKGNSWDQRYQDIVSGLEKG